MEKTPPKRRLFEESSVVPNSKILKVLYNSVKDSYDVLHVNISEFFIRLVRDQGYEGVTRLILSDPFLLTRVFGC